MEEHAVARLEGGGVDLGDGLPRGRLAGAPLGVIPGGGIDVVGGRVNSGATGQRHHAKHQYAPD